MRTVRPALLLVALLLCPRADGAGELALRLLLVGDAGAPGRAGEPVLDALRAEAGREPGRTVTVFLGDNVYPWGLPPDGSADRPEADRRLGALLGAGLGPGGTTLFLAGNHDWGPRGDGTDPAWLAREADAVRRRGGGHAIFLPAPGEEVPAVLDAWPGVRLVAVDTDLWLRSPERAARGATALGALLSEQGSRRVILLTHHPVRTGGPHGGSFGWKDHLFPLRNAVSWLWLPLPLLGSSYPLARKAGISRQDLSSTEYAHMDAAFRTAFRTRRPFAWASGHDHGLQVLAGEAPFPRHLLVSGAGSASEITRVGALRGTRMALAAPGFMVLDLFEDGRARLRVVAIRREGPADVWAAELD